MHLKPFDYYDSAKWFPSWPERDKAIVYGVTGGIPYYLEQFSPERSLKENLIASFFNSNSVLFNEREFYLREEFREIEVYGAIISAIANGKTRYSEIADAARLANGALSSYLENLERTGIVGTLGCIDGSEKYKLYIVKDLFFRFWSFFVPRNWSSIISGRIARSYDLAIEPLMNDYMGKVFETICAQYLEFRCPQLPFPPKMVGTWWGTNPRTRKSAEIDIVMTSAIDSDVLIGSCKFRNKSMDEAELALMEDYADAMGTRGRRYFCLFSAGGFSEGLRALEGERVRLVGLEDLYSDAVLS